MTRPNLSAVAKVEHDAPKTDGRATGKSEWGEPDWSILDDRRGELPEFPDDVFSPTLQAWLERAAHGAGVTTAHVAVPMLGVSSSLIGIARCICPSRTWSEPCSMWTAIVADSGTGKTHGLDVPKRALARIGQDRRVKLAALELAHETKVEAAKVASKKWKTDVEVAIETGKSPPEMPAGAVNPGPFTAPRLYVSNATTERIAVLLQARPRGMLMIADELASLFLNMSRYSKGQDNEFWLECFNGKPYIVERMGRPPVAVDHLLVGVVGGLQPDKLARSFAGDADGMYARLCFAWPTEPRYRPLNNDADDIDPIIYNAMTRLIDLPSEAGGRFASRKVNLSSEAVKTFERFRQFAHDQRALLDGREREWFGKGNSRVLRLAGTLSFLDWAVASGAELAGPEPTHIEDSFVAAAIRLVRDYFWPHARAALRQIGLSERHASARQVLKWARAHRKPEVSREDIRRTALGQKLDADQTEGLLGDLAKKGWCREIKLPPGRQGGKPARRWHFNPLLFNPTAETAETAQTTDEMSQIGLTEEVSALSAVCAAKGGTEEALEEIEL
jgi:hypothetical protein